MDQLQPMLGRLREGNCTFKLEGTNGLDIPYVGYVSTTVEMGGVEIPNCGILVTKDTPATACMRKKVPGIIGTNILAQVPQFKDLLQKERKIRTGFAKVAGSTEVWVPPLARLMY